MARKSKGLHLHPLIAVYCEGASEVAYFKMCQRKQHAANVKTEKLKVESLNRGGVALLQAARAKRDRLVGTKRVEQTYVVFDRDAMTAAKLQQCEKYAKQYDLKLVFSSTNFDIWILMHFEPVMRAYTRLALNRKLSGAGYFTRDCAAPMMMSGITAIRIRIWIRGWWRSLGRMNGEGGLEEDNMCQQDPIVPAGSPYTGWHLSELEAFLADPIPDESVIQAASAAREALLAEWARHDTHDQPDLPF